MLILLAKFLGYAIVLLIAAGIPIWVLYSVEFLSFCIGVIGGLYEQITKQKGIF